MIIFFGIIKTVCDFLLAVMQSMDGWHLAGVFVACATAVYLFKQVKPGLRIFMSSRLTRWIGQKTVRTIATSYRLASGTTLAFVRTRFHQIQERRSVSALREPELEQELEPTIGRSEGPFSLLPGCYHLGRKSWDSFDTPTFERKGIMLNY